MGIDGRIFPVEFVIALCLAYGVSADWLLCGLGQRQSRR
jgi:hypothetical protein